MKTRLPRPYISILKQMSLPWKLCGLTMIPNAWIDAAKECLTGEFLDVEPVNILKI